jgi:hypothetical protein
MTGALAGEPPGGGALEGHVLLGVEVEDGAVVAHLRQHLRNITDCHYMYTMCVCVCVCVRVCARARARAHINRENITEKVY